MRLSRESLLTTDSSWAFFVSSSYREIAIDVMTYRNEHAVRSETVTRVLRGFRCRTWFDVFDHWPAALQFPYYFGYNINAFGDCIEDLGWLQAKHYVFIVTSADELLAEESTQGFAAFLSVLEDAARAWAQPSPLEHSPPKIRAQYGRGAVSFRVLFQSVPGNMEAMRERYASVRYNFPEMGSNAP